MHRRLNRIFKVLAALVMALSLNSPTLIGSARHVHHYARVRINRPYNHWVRHRGHHDAVRLKRHQKLTRRHRRQISQRQIKRNMHEIYRQTIIDINRDRKQNRVARLRTSRQLSRIGTVRSRQLIRYFSHNTRSRTNEVQHLLDRDRVNYEYYGENIASSPLGTIRELAVGSYSNPTDADQSDIRYHARNGYQLANNINNASMDHDTGDNNGHRANDLDHQFKQIGVGVSYSPNDQNYYVATEFVG